MDHRYFLEIDGVRGMSTDPRHIGSIEALGIHWSHGRPQGIGAGNGGGLESQSQPGDLVITKAGDVTSAFLMRASTDGRMFREATLTIEKRTFIGLYVRSALIRMRSVMIHSVRQRGQFDEVILNFDHLFFEHGGTQAIPAAARDPFDWRHGA